MDLALYGRVLRRFWWLVLVGLTLAIVLSIVSVARVSSNGLAYRSNEVWEEHDDASFDAERQDLRRTRPITRRSPSCTHSSRTATRCESACSRRADTRLSTSLEMFDA